MIPDSTLYATMNISFGQNCLDKKKPIWVYSSSPLKRGRNNKWSLLRRTSPIAEMYKLLKFISQLYHKFNLSEMTK